MLRTELFKTLERAETRFICVRDTLTKPAEKMDVRRMDAIHCRQGRLGIGWHFLVQLNGTIQLGRDINTVGSHSRNFDTLSVALGVVGGVDENGDKLFTRNQEQIEAIDDLIKFLTSRYPGSEVNDNPHSI